MTQRTILIADDEPPARRRLSQLIAEAGLGLVVGEAADGRECLEQVSRLRPDVLFLDITMPELSGLEVMEALPPEARPAVVLTTAHVEYALEAFERDVVDYLVKPFDRARVAEAWRRARRHLAVPRAEEEWLVVRNGDAHVRLGTRDVVAIIADGNYARLITRDAGYLMRGTMASLEERLARAGFMAVSRSALVKVEHASSLRRSRHGDATLTLSNGVEVRVSRTHRQRLEAAMGST